MACRGYQSIITTYYYMTILFKFAEPHATASENIDEEPDENVEEQSARYESDEGEEEV